MLPAPAVAEPLPLRRRLQRIVLPGLPLHAAGVVAVVAAAATRARISIQ
jgi:hypothetical protein